MFKKRKEKNFKWPNGKRVEIRKQIKKEDKQRKEEVHDKGTKFRMCDV